MATVEERCTGAFGCAKKWFFREVWDAAESLLDLSGRIDSFHMQPKRANACGSPETSRKTFGCRHVERAHLVVVVLQGCG